MAGAITQETAQHLRAALDEVLSASHQVSSPARAAFERLVDVLETSTDAVVLPADETISTQQAATLLGVSRMTVVRLIERGELRLGGGAVHRRIAVSELARYQADSARRRRMAITELAADINEETPPDEVVTTR